MKKVKFDLWSNRFHGVNSVFLEKLPYAMRKSTGSRIWTRLSDRIDDRLMRAIMNRIGFTG